MGDASSHNWRWGNGIRLRSMALVSMVLLVCLSISNLTRISIDFRYISFRFLKLSLLVLILQFFKIHSKYFFKTENHLLVFVKVGIGLTVYQMNIFILIDTLLYRPT